MDSNALYEINRSIVNSLLDTVDVSKDKDIFLLLLKGIKDNYGLCTLLSENTLEKAMDALKFFDEEYEKAWIINSILNIMVNMEFDCGDNLYDIETLLGIYLDAVSEGYHVLEDISETLFLFIHLGIDKKHAISELVQRCNEKFVIRILLKMGIVRDFIKDVGEVYPELGILLEKKAKFRDRFDLLLHFYLMTNAQYYENIDIAGDYLKTYSNYVAICADWSFSSCQFNHKYVLDNIITEEEEQAFIAIGDLFYDCMDESAPESEEELFEYLKNASDKFGYLLKTDKVQEIINKVIKRRQFSEIAFCLPE